MKSQKLNNIILVITCMLFSSLVSVAATGNLFDSNEVVYDNTSSGMSSTNVKTAVDELYAAATDYSDINTRVTNLESNFRGNSLENNHAIELNYNSGTLSNYGGYIDFHYNKSTNDYTSRIIESGNGYLEVKADNGIALNKSVATDRGLKLGMNASNSNGYLDIYYGGQLTGNMSADAANTLNIAAWKNGTAGTGSLNLNGGTINIGSGSSVVKANGSNVVTDSTKTAFSLTLSSGITAATNKCYKIGAIYTCSLWFNALNLTNFPASTEVVLGQVPSAYKPADRAWCGVGYSGTNVTSNIYAFINTDGKLYAAHKDGTISMFMINVTWVI